MALVVVVAAMASAIVTVVVSGWYMVVVVLIVDVVGVGVAVNARPLTCVGLLSLVHAITGHGVKGPGLETGASSGMPQSMQKGIARAPLRS